MANTEDEKKSTAEELLPMEELVVYRSPDLDSENPKGCKVHQGDNVTLVECENSYELYETHALSVTSSGLENLGEKRPAKAINKS